MRSVTSGRRTRMSTGQRGSFLKTHCHQWLSVPSSPVGVSEKLGMTASLNPYDPLDVCVCTHAHRGGECDELGCGCTIFEALGDPNVRDCSPRYRALCGYTTSHPYGANMRGSAEYPI